MLKLAIVHDWILGSGGAEKVLKEILDTFPGAPVYVLFYNTGIINKEFSGVNIKTSFLQKIPYITKIYKYLFFLMPAAVESFDLSGFKIIVSSSVIFSKGLILKPNIKHICYCFSPTRQVWDQSHEYSAEENSWLAKLSQHFLRLWDIYSSERPDKYIAISKTVANRIMKYYGKNSEVIYPPVKENLTPINYLVGDYYLLVARLFTFKNILSVIQAFNKLGKKLVIVGEGPEKNKIKKMAGGNVIFAGRLNSWQLSNFYGHAKAIILPSEEDFGLTAVESMKHGRPVIALKRGGAVETIAENKTGIFFDDPIPEAIAEAVIRFESNQSNFNYDVIFEESKKFSGYRFSSNIKAIIKT